jgi:hypothetical protein
MTMIDDINTRSIRRLNLILIEKKMVNRQILKKSNSHQNLRNEQSFKIIVSSEVKHSNLKENFEGERNKTLTASSFVVDESLLSFSVF